MDLISVIIPIYNVEKYLNQCIQSVVNQTYRNLEIILVDDGSPDNCPAICDAWAAKDSRIKVIHKKNGGLSDARNAGIYAATGQLIGFVDSDDWIEPEMYHQLYDYMNRDGSDIAACGVEMVWENGTPARMLTGSGNGVLHREAAVRAIVEETQLKQPVWYKLYRRDLLRDIAFPVGKYHEDAFWSYQVIGRATRVTYFDVPLYHYTQRSGSIMGEAFSMKRLDGLEARVQQLAFVREKFPTLEGSAQARLLGACRYLGQLALRSDDPEMYCRAVARIRPIYRKEARHLRFHPAAKERIWLVLGCINFTICCKLRNRLGIGV